MRLFKIYESYDKAAFEDFRFHAAELFPEYWEVLNKKFYEDIDYKKMQPRKVERNKMKEQGDKMLDFMAEHIEQRVVADNKDLIRMNKIAHIEDPKLLCDVMTDNFKGVSFVKLGEYYKYSYGMIFRWVKKIDELALEDDDVALIVLCIFAGSKK